MGRVQCTVSLPEAFQTMAVDDGGLVRSGPSWHLSLPAEGSGVGLVESCDHHHHSLPLADRNVRIQKVFNGHLRITNENFLDAYENSTSTEFISLASQVKEAVSLLPGEVLCPACPSTVSCTKDSSLLPDPWAGDGVGPGSSLGKGPCLLFSQL